MSLEKRTLISMYIKEIAIEIEIEIEIVIA